MCPHLISAVFRLHLSSAAACSDILLMRTGLGFTGAGWSSDQQLQKEEIVSVIELLSHKLPVLVRVTF